MIYRVQIYNSLRISDALKNFISYINFFTTFIIIFLVCFWAFNGGLGHVPLTPHEGSIEQPLTSRFSPSFVLDASGLKRHPEPLLFSATAFSSNNVVKTLIYEIYFSRIS